jgi:SAM-dependent methyltransferase
MSWVKRLYFNLLYFGKPPWDTQVSPPELMEYIENNPPGRALDLGCGTGTNVITLAQHGWEVIGVDGRAIRHAQRKANQAGVKAEFVINSVSKLDGVKGPFDLVLDIGCFHSLEAGERDRYITNLGRLTEPGSTLLLYAFLKESGENGPGISESDLTNFERLYALSRRVDGFERGESPSAWLTFERKADKHLEKRTIS